MAEIHPFRDYPAQGHDRFSNTRTTIHETAAVVIPVPSPTAPPLDDNRNDIIYQAEVISAPSPTAPSPTAPPLDDHAFQNMNKNMSSPSLLTRIRRIVKGILTLVLLVLLAGGLYIYFEPDSWLASFVLGNEGSNTAPSPPPLEPSAVPSFAPPCSDDPTYSFQIDLGTTKKCGWLKHSTNRQNRYCNRIIDDNGSKISDSCQKSCALCTIFSNAPSVPPKKSKKSKKGSKK